MDIRMGGLLSPAIECSIIKLTIKDSLHSFLIF